MIKYYNSSTCDEDDLENVIDSSSFTAHSMKPLADLQFKARALQFKERMELKQQKMKQQEEQQQVQQQQQPLISTVPE